MDNSGWSHQVYGIYETLFVTAYTLWLMHRESAKGLRFAGFQALNPKP